MRLVRGSIGYQRIRCTRSVRVLILRISRYAARKRFRSFVATLGYLGATMREERATDTRDEDTGKPVP